MRGSRTILAAAMTVGLMASASISATAQDVESGPSPVAYATGAMAWPPAEIMAPDVEPVPGGNEERGLMLIDVPVEFTDSRLSGLLTVSGNGATRETPDGRAWIESRTHRIVNDDGAWAGSGYLVRSSELGADVDEESMVLVGEDAYEGYIAYIFGDPADEAAPLKALILQAELPPLPEPVAAG